MSEQEKTSSNRENLRRGLIATASSITTLIALPIAGIGLITIIDKETAQFVQTTVKGVLSHAHPIIESSLTFITKPLPLFVLGASLICIAGYARHLHGRLGKSKYSIQK